MPCSRTAVDVNLKHQHHEILKTQNPFQISVFNKEDEDLWEGATNAGTKSRMWKAAAAADDDDDIPVSDDIYF
jgi:hypothetical protein